MTIEKICTKQVVSVEANVKLQEAIQLMSDQQVGCVVVVDSKDMMPMPIGILTDRDILVRAIAKGLSPISTTVKDVMTKDVVSLDADMSTYKALGYMRLNGVRRAPLTNKQGELVGIVTMDDLLNFLADEFSQLADLIRRATKRSTYRD